MDDKRIADQLARTEGVSAWHFLLQRREETTVIRLPGKDEPWPEVELGDPDLVGLEPPALLDKAQEFINGIVEHAARLESVDVSNVELFITRLHNRLRTSAGGSLDYPSTRLTAEVCFLARPGDDKVGEHTARLSARRLADLDPRVIVAEYGVAARSIALAGSPPTRTGPVVLTGEAAADFFTVGNTPLALHSGARAVFEKTSRHEAGKPVYSGELKGEPPNILSDPLLPCGLASTVCNMTDAGAARKVTLCKDGNWDNLFGGRRYFHYLGLLGEGKPAPGRAGNTVIPAGPTPVVGLLTDDAVVVRAFSAFEVDASSGQFSVEIRLGETRKNGETKPFTSGLLVGNWFEAIADVRFSKETQVFGSYHGPKAVRFGNLKVAG